MSRRGVSIGDRPKKPTRAVRLPEKPPPPSLADEANALVERVKTITVRTQEECTEAAILAREIRARRKKWEQHEKPVVDKAKAAYDEARERYNLLDKPMKRAEDVLKEMIGNFKLRARELAEASLKATNETTVQQEQERLGQFLRETEDATAAALAKRQAEIDAATAAGDMEKAARLLNAPLDVETPDLVGGIMIGPGDIVGAMTPEDGVSVGEKWEFAIVDESLVPDEFWAIDPRRVQAVVAISKGATRIPGIRVFRKPRVGLR